MTLASSSTYLGRPFTLPEVITNTLLQIQPSEISDLWMVGPTNHIWNLFKAIFVHFQFAWIFSRSLHLLSWRFVQLLISPDIWFEEALRILEGWYYNLDRTHFCFLSMHAKSTHLFAKQLQIKRRKFYYSLRNKVFSCHHYLWVHVQLRVSKGP